jgi:hypothetical protein
LGGELSEMHVKFSLQVICQRVPDKIDSTRFEWVLKDKKDLHAAKALPNAAINESGSRVSVAPGRATHAAPEGAVAHIWHEKERAT